MYKLLIYLYLLFISITNALGQDQKTLLLNNITKHEGLPSNFITDIVKDNLGFIWIGTNDGLCRYDGPRGVRVFKVDTLHHKIGLASNHIETLFLDSRNNLWVGTRIGGLTRYHQESNTWKTFRHQRDKESSISNNDILSIFEDSQKRLWVGTENGLNLYDYETEEFMRIMPNEQVPNSMKGNAVLSVMEDNRGWIWIGTWGGGINLLLSDKEPLSSNSKFKYFQPTSKPESLNIWKIYQDRLGNYWVGSFGGGLFLMQLPENATNDIKQPIWTPIFHNYTKEDADGHSIAHNAIQDLWQDRQGNLWIGTVEGLSQIQSLNHLSKGAISSRPTLKFQNNLHKAGSQTSIVGNVISSILEDDQGLLWFGTLGGISQYNSNVNQFNIVNLVNKMGELQNAQNICTDTNGNVWLISSASGLFKGRINDEEIEFSTINDEYPNLLLDKQGSSIYSKNGEELFVGTKLGITQLNTNTFKTEYFPTPDWLRKSLPHFFIKKIFVDQDGLIWIGTEMGLFLLRPQTGEYTHHTNQPDDSTSISDSSINDIFQDANGTIWIATWKGLNIVKSINGNDVKFEQFVNSNETDKPKIPSNQVLALNQMGDRLYIGSSKGLYSYHYPTKKFETYLSVNNNMQVRNIQITKDNKLWISGIEGLLFFDPQDRSFNYFDKYDGIGEGQFRQAAGIQDKKGNIYFARNGGLTCFNPEEIKKNNIKPPVYITDIKKISTKATSTQIGIFEKEIELNHNDYYLSINFAALNYNRAEKNQYAYKLEGFDDQWYYTKFGNPIVYTNLTPNTYQLRIKASNNDEVWNEEGATLMIIKHPAFWQTWWFKLGGILAGLLLIITGFRFYSTNIRSRNNFLNKEIEERKKMEKIVVNKEKFLRLIMDNAPQFICWVDKDFHFLGGNATFLNFLNLKKEDELIGKNIIDFPFHSNYIRKLYGALANVIKTEVPVYNEVAQMPQTEDFPSLWLEQSFIPLYHEDDSLLGMLICGSNISSRVKSEKRAKAHNEKLKEFNEELKRSNKDLEQFAYIASHDLKEPLRIIGNFSGLLSRSYKTKLDKNAFEYIDFIEDGVNRMTNLIHSLLTYSRVGRKESTFRTIDLNRLLALNVHDLSQAIKEKNGKVIINSLPNIFGEKEQIGMVFQNLISNALKFNKRKQPIITVKEELSADPDFWQFSVTDNGIGIAPNYHQQIFGVFRRLHGKREYAGTGIGLAVCQKVIFRHQGKIWLESTVEIGTTFHFTISKKLEHHHLTSKNKSLPEKTLSKL